ncbi:PqqD family protein [Cognatiluteimonas profundi]|uniref:PqqD family protein n=1 Tax=Cognatiluteimonas profundi TaxID=2594501 RepID=UPI0018EF0D75|nr:PqqD family protein [Lysobacter profundi]
MRSPLAQPLTLACRAQPSARVRLQQTGDEAVLLDLASEYYFGLDAVGTRLWRLLEHDPGVRNAFDTLLGEYDVSADRLEHDLLAVLAQLADAGLVTIE